MMTELKDDKGGIDRVTPAALAAIREAAVNELRCSKRSAGSSDELMIDRATKLKAGKEDAQPLKGDNPKTPTFSHLTDSFIQSGFSSIDLKLGTDEARVTSSILKMKSAVECRALESQKVDWKIDALDREEKEICDEQEIGTFILNNICGEIMDEVMDGSSDLMDYTTTLPKPKHKGKVKVKVSEYSKHRNSK